MVLDEAVIFCLEEEGDVDEDDFDDGSDDEDIVLEPGDVVEEGLLEETLLEEEDEGTLEGVWDDDT